MQTNYSRPRWQRDMISRCRISVRSLIFSYMNGNYLFSAYLILPSKHFFFTRSNSAILRAERTNLHPASANTYANSSPIPLDAPVIHTFFPFNEAMQDNVWNEIKSESLSVKRTLQRRMTNLSVAVFRVGQCKNKDERYSQIDLPNLSLIASATSQSKTVAPTM